MSLRQLTVFTLFLACGPVATGQEPAGPVEARPPASTNTPQEQAVPAEPVADPVEAERQRLRKEFIDARMAFNDLVTARLNSREARQGVQNFSLRLRLNKAEDRLRAVQRRLDRVELSGRGETNEAQRLRDREAALIAEVESLSNPDPAARPADPIASATPALVNVFRQRWIEETEFLADVLSNEELARRAQQMRKLAAFTGAAEGLRDLLHEKAAGAQGEPVTPAGGQKLPQPASGSGAPDDALGTPTTAPPASPPPTTGDSLSSELGEPQETTPQPE